MITLKNVKIEYDEIILLNQQQIDFKAGKLSVISGPSGCGKTSLLYILGLISRNDNYSYYYDQRVIKTSQDKAKIRKNNIGYIFQDKNLQYNLTIYQNIDLYAKIAGKKIDSVNVKELLELVDLSIDASRIVKTLSGGEKQRVAIACALVKEPDIIIADEPTSSLDEKNKLNIVNIFKKLAATYNKCIIVASHDNCFYDNADVLYQFKDSKLLITENKVPNLKKENQINKYKSSKSFYQTILKYKYNDYFKSMKKIIWLSFIIILISGLALSINQGVIDNYIEKINNLTPNEIKMIDVFDEEDLIYIGNIPGVTSIRPYYEISGTFENTYFSNAIIHTYYPEDLLPQNLLKNNGTDGIYLSYSYKDYTGNNVSFEYKGVTYEYEVSGIFDVSYSDIYQSLYPVIYIPHTFFENNYKSDKYIVEVMNIQSIDSTIDRIVNINNTIKLSSEYKDINSLLAMQENITVFVKIGVAILILVSFITVSMSQVLDINSRIYEISLFKANGVNNAQLFGVEILRIGFILIIGNLIVDLIGTIILYFCNNLTSLTVVAINSGFYLQVLIISVFSMVVPIIISLFKITKLSMEEVLRG